MVAPLVNVVLLLSPYYHIRIVGTIFIGKKRDKRYHGIKNDGAHSTHHVKDDASQFTPTHRCAADDVRKEIYYHERRWRVGSTAYSVRGSRTCTPGPSWWMGQDGYDVPRSVLIKLAC